MLTTEALDARQPEVAAFRLREIVAGDAAGLNLITELHMELLGFGPMAQFGDRVIRETVYAVALKHAALHVVIAEVNGRPAGFIAYTTKRQVFHSELLRRNIFRTAGVMLVSLLEQPRRLAHLPRAFKVVFSRSEMPAGLAQIKSEVVCFGVRPEYLTLAFVRETGLRVGLELLEHAFAALRQSGCGETIMIVDADNPRALFFYKSLDAEMTACVFGGVPSYLVRFAL